MMLSLSMAMPLTRHGVDVDCRASARLHAECIYVAEAVAYCIVYFPSRSPSALPIVFSSENIKLSYVLPIYVMI